MEKIALYPGGFKPPQGGHYDAAKYLAKNCDVDSILIIVGPLDRDGITMEQSIKIWDIYRQNDPDPLSKLFNIIPTKSPTPVRDVYELIENELPNGSEVYLGLGEKETDGRWDNISKFADPKNIKFEIVPIPPQKGGISGTQMRSFIKEGDKESFAKYLPNHLSEGEIDQIWDIVFSIDEVLDEGVRDFIKKNSDKVKNLISRFKEAWTDQKGDFKGYKDLVLKYLDDKESLTPEEKEKLQRNTIDLLKTAGLAAGFPIMGFSGTILLAFLVKRITGGKYTTLPSKMGNLLNKSNKEEEEIDEMMAGTMNKQEMEKHQKNINKLKKDLRKQGDQYVEVPDYIHGTLTRKLYEIDTYEDKPLKAIIVENKKEPQLKEDLGFDYWYEHFSNQLTEGGAAGHMKHPFELDSVETSTDLVKIFKDAYNSVKNGNSSLKIDGINASIRLANIQGNRQFVMDRGTKKDLDLKGITQDDLEDRFGEGHGMVKIGNEILPLFNDMIPQIKPELIKLGMWENPYIIFNMEYVDGHTNVQQYDDKFLAIHGLRELKFVEATNSNGTYQKRISEEIPYDKAALRSLVNKLNNNKQGFKVYDNIQVNTKSIPDLNSALNQRHTIIDGGKKETKTLLQWLKDLDKIPKLTKVRISDGGSEKIVNALSKQVYLGVFDGKDVSLLFKDSNDRKEAIKGAITYLATEKLGNAVLQALDSPLGKVDEHEGIVISDPKINGGTTFKITGNFITRGMDSKFREGKISPYNLPQDNDYSNFYTSDIR